MARFLFVPHRGREDAALIAKKEIERLTAMGHEVVVMDDDAHPTGLTRYAISNVADAVPDLAVSLGGDGSMLRSLDLVCDYGVPVLGVNVGHLGYLTEVEPDDVSVALDRYLAGDYMVERRMTLDVRVTSQGKLDPTRTHLSLGHYIAVNEVVVEKASGGTVRLQTTIDDEPFLSYAVDGMIVATPTGSTAYNLSADGPIVSPSLALMLLTPVSPHMLFDRTLVLDGAEHLQISVIGSRDANVIVDGRTIASVTRGGTVTCTQSDRPALIVSFGGRNFRHVLKAKFGLLDR
jgi:NAD+ kinase